MAGKRLMTVCTDFHTHQPYTSMPGDHHWKNNQAVPVFSLYFTAKLSKLQARSKRSLMGEAATNSQIMGIQFLVSASYPGTWKVLASVNQQGFGGTALILCLSSPYPCTQLFLLEENRGPATCCCSKGWECLVGLFPRDQMLQLDWQECGHHKYTNTPPTSSWGEEGGGEPT